jgi:hypothetical protein
VSTEGRTADRSGRRGGLAPWLLVFFVGMAGLGAYLLIRPLLSPIASEGYYHPPLYAFTYAFNKPALLLFIPYALALLAWWRGHRVAFGWILGGAIALHVLLVLAPPPGTQDINQYLFYGRMQVVHHWNPYVVQPAAHGLNNDLWYSWIRWPTQTAVYGPVWTLLTAAAVAVAGSSHSVAYVVMKLVVLGLDLATMWLIVVAARDSERLDGHGGRGAGFAAGFGLLAYAWNPLILLSVPLGGLADVALAAGLLAAFVARRRGHPLLTTVLLTATALVKVYAGVALLLHLVLLARERDRKRAAGHAAVAVGLSAAAFAPYWAGLATFEGLAHIAGLSNHSLAGTIQRLLAPVFGLLGLNAPHHDAGAVVRWLGTAILVGTVVWVTARVRNERDLWHGTLVVLCVYILVTPWFLYWYLVAPIALVAVMPTDRLTAPVLTASGTALITTAFPPWLLAQTIEMIERYAPPLLVFAWLRRRGAGRAAEKDVVVVDGPRAPEPARRASPSAFSRDATAAR